MTAWSADADPWVAEEGRLLAVARRTLLRPLRRPVLVGSIALGLTALAILLRAAQPAMYQGTILFRVEETGLTDATASTPSAPRKIQEHVENVALSRRKVEEIMRRHDYSVAWLDRDREAAIEDFRSEITIDVSRDYFVLQRRAGDPPRSAHVSVSMTGFDKDEVTAILRGLGEAVIEAQKSERSGGFAGSSVLLRSELDAAREELAGLQAETSQLWGEVSGARADRQVQIRARLASLELLRSAALQRVVTLERRANELDMGVAAEEGQLELSFGSFDESLLVLRPHLGPGQLARRAVVVLLGALLLVVVFIGAFDDRVLDPEDLSARGIPVLGALPRFSGDEAGALRDRLKPSKPG